MPGQAATAGGGYVFNRPASGWVEDPDTELTDPDTTTDDEFGQRFRLFVATSGTRCWSGATATRGGGQQHGGGLGLHGARRRLGGGCPTHRRSATRATISAPPWPCSQRQHGRGRSSTGNTVVGAAYEFTEPGTGWGGVDQIAEFFPVAPRGDDFGHRLRSMPAVIRWWWEPDGVSSSQGAVYVSRSPSSVAGST